MATLLLFGRMVLALSAVLGAIYVLARISRRVQRRERPGAASMSRIEVLAKKNLTRSSALVLVKSQGRKFLLGSTPQTVSLICDLGEASNDDTPELTPESAPKFGLSSSSKAAPWMATVGGQRPPTAWDALVATLKERSVRR